MKTAFTAPGDYIYFKSQVPLHKIPIGTKQWRYFDFGPKSVPPLICIPGTAGTADVYYKQIMALSMKGYRVISVDIPRVWNHHEWIQAFEKFLDAIDVHHIHIYGSSLGGFLAQLFAQHRPRRVRSLILSNTFLDTRTFSSAMPWAPFVNWTPPFLLKRYVLTGIKDGPHEPFIADSVDFVVSQVETLSREDLASRLTLTVNSASVGHLLLSDAFITIMDTNDYCAIPQLLKDEVGERYPEAKRACLKTGGDFPFLSRPDEVNLHLQLHLRRVGAEAQPELVPSMRKNGSGTNPSREERKEYNDDPSKDEGSSAGPSKSNEREDPDDPPKEEEEEDDDGDDYDEENPEDDNEREDPPKDDSDDDDGSPEGPSRSDGKKDADDPPTDNWDSYEGSSTNKESQSGINDEDSTKDNPRGSDRHSKTDERRDANDLLNDHQQNLEVCPETTDFQISEKPLLRNEKRHYLISPDLTTRISNPDALEEPRNRIPGRSFCDLTRAFFVYYYLLIPIHMGSLIRKTWIDCCISAQLV
ncbi:hypothetical protein Nepgr_028470 [Nepenthes gracilis]|uniref:Maspardin n=1 Tax=Nepenthes gracilis TaxID=150966 RepID=A0AAD3TDS9_NEPGR|nr:hypothetical protein Nepgr_028470 [Nepenthes gracilis]